MHKLNVYSYALLLLFCIDLCTAAFNRVATFHVCQQLEASCNLDTRTNAADVSVSSDGTTLVYADAFTNSLGFVSISNPEAPKGISKISLQKSPIAVRALVKSKIVVALSVDQETEASELVAVLNVATGSTPAIVRTIPLSGVASSLAVSEKHIVVVSSSRDNVAETLTIIDSSSTDPAMWSIQNVADIGNTQRESKTDVSIHKQREICAVSLSTSNLLVYMNLTDATVIDSVSLGNTEETLWMDTRSNGIILQRDLLRSQSREPQAVTWIGDDNLLATADLGSRTWTGMNVQSANRAAFSAGREMDHEAVRTGHYPEVSESQS
jgi:hypothetical protein